MLKDALLTCDFVLTPASFHPRFIREKNNDFSLNFTLLTQSQLIKELVIDIHREQAVYKVMKFLNFTYSKADYLLSKLTFIPIASTDPVLHELHLIYELLKDHHCIIEHPLADYKFRNKRIGVYGYDALDPRFKLLSEQYQITWVFLHLPKIDAPHDLLTFSSIDDEVYAFFNRVAYLLDQKVNIQNIVLFNPNETYYEAIQRFSKYFHIPVNIPSRHTWWQLPIAQAWYQLYCDLNDVKSSFSTLHGFANEQKIALQKLIDSTPLEEHDDAFNRLYLLELLKATRVDNQKLTGVLQVKDYSWMSDDEYLFILGFNQGIFPHIARDNDFISDALKHTSGLLTSTDDNNLQRTLIINQIKTTKHIYLSCSLFSDTSALTPSPLAGHLNMNILPPSAHHLLANGIDYGQQYGLIKTAIDQEFSRRYHTHHPLLKSYQAQFNQPIQKFSHLYQKLSINLSTVPFKHSYSSINDFYQCQFKYYLTQILKIKDDLDPFHINLGNLVHKVFQHTGYDLSTFDDVFDKTLLDMHTLSSKEHVIFRNLKDRIKAVVMFNKTHLNHMNHVDTRLEQPLSIQIDDHTTLFGKVDKIVITEDAEKKPYLSLIDFKTGKESFNAKLVEHGLSLQLPIYALLMTQNLAFEGYEVIGIFIQHVLSNQYKDPINDTLKQPLSTYFQLDGLMTVDQGKLSTFDDSFLTGLSSFIKGIRQNKDGSLRANKRFQTIDGFHSLATNAYNKVKEANNKIRDNDFVINPKLVGNNPVCTHCPFQDICFRQSSDFVTLVNEEEDQDYELE
jgi:hypothetical protein